MGSLFERARHSGTEVEAIAAADHGGEARIL
jgi:hypothetical protein